MFVLFGLLFFFPFLSFFKQKSKVEDQKFGEDVERNILDLDLGLFIRRIFGNIRSRR